MSSRRSQCHYWAARTRRPGIRVGPGAASEPVRRPDSCSLRRSYRDPGWWGASRHQGGDELAEEGPATAAGVVHELEESEIERQLLLRDAPVRPQPGAQQRPDPLHGVDVDLAEAVAVVIPSVLAPRVADGFVPVAPLLQARVDVVLVGVDQGACGDGGLDDRLDRDLLDIGQHVQCDFTAALDQAQDRWLLFGQRASAGCTLEPAPSPQAAFLATAAGLP